MDISRPAGTQGLPDEALQEVNRLWTIVRAFSNAAHDVNNALQVIAGSAELIEAREIDPMLRRRVEAIRMQAARAASSIDRLLSYSRDSREGQRTLDLGALVDAAVAMRAYALGRAHIHIAVDRSDSEPRWVAVDRNRALQAFLNVLLWAEETVKACRNGRIGVRFGRNLETVFVAVTATGDGEGPIVPFPGADPPSTGAEHLSAVASVTLNAQIWAAAQLVAIERGTLQFVEGATTATMSVSFPSVQVSA